MGFFGKLKKLAKVAWGKIKQLPAWAIGLILFLVAVGVYLFKQVQIRAQIAKIRKEQIAIEQARYKTVQDVSMSHAFKQRVIEKKYDVKLRELEEEKSKLLDAASDGPGEIANAWKEYLENR